MGLLPRVSLWVFLPQSPPESLPSQLEVPPTGGPPRVWRTCTYPAPSVIGVSLLRLTEKPPFFSTSFNDITFALCDPPKPPFVEPRKYLTTLPAARSLRGVGGAEPHVRHFEELAAQVSYTPQGRTLVRC